MPDLKIQYLKSSDIDRDKWDACIASAPEGLIYNTSIYLDMLADNWNAVVIGDYEAVLPLPWRKKLFLKYHYHVPFIAQGGLTGIYPPRVFRYMTRMLSRHIRYGDLILNHRNEEYALYLGATTIPNMVLDLSVEFPHIHKRYHHDLEKNLRKASKYELQFGAGNEMKLAVEIFRKQYSSRLPSVRGVDYERFTGLCLHLHKMNKAVIRKVTDAKGRLLAIAIFLKDHARIYNIMNTVTPEGRRRSANHFLFDQTLREFSGSGLIMDFEGSQVPGIRKFYENFGAVNEPYYWYRKYPVLMG